MKRVLFIALLVVFACEDKEKDCAGVEGGDATVDDCGLCTGGATGLLPNYLKDCFGECGGTSELDECGVCNNYETQPDFPYGDCDCLGIPNGDALLDNCDVCDSDTTNDCVQDCADEWGGTAEVDSCNVCGGNNNNCIGDIVGNWYKTVTIGTQVWMAENLKVSRYNNGDEIPTGYSYSEWSNLSTGAYTVYPYDNEESCQGNCAEVYGNLYNWYAVETGNLAPEGWHVPTHAEYTALEDYLGGIYVAGGKMKECTEGSCPESEYWDSPNTGATNESGFTALPGGYRYYGYGSYNSMGDRGYFWSSSGAIGSFAWYWSLNNLHSEVDRQIFNRKYGFSVRCIKD